MSSEGEICLELILHDGSNYEYWCISILHNIDAFNPYLLSIVDSSICSLNINWANLLEEERKCLKLNAQAICLLTQSLSPNIEALIIKEHEFPVDAHLLWKYIKYMFSKTTTAQDSRGAASLAKLVKPVEQTGQTGLDKSAGSRLQRRKHHRSNKESTTQTSSLPYENHGKCLMAKDKKKKKPKKVESEEEDDDECDLDFDKLSKKDMIKIKKLFGRLQEQELQLEQQEGYLIGKIEELKALNEEHEKLKHLHTSLIGKHEKLEKEYACATNVSSCVDPLEKENAKLKTQHEVLTSKLVKMQKDYKMLTYSHEDLQAAHPMLQVSHEVVVTSVKHFQSHTQECTCSPNFVHSICANACCSQSQQSNVEQINVDSFDDLIAKENDLLKLEVQRLKSEMVKLKGMTLG
jgi:hypothetical protein